ncbi:MAG: DUF4969 domain-containing protein [Bacteroidales bacterium]|nr:DUF4969 domain-containing protein [Bacteroidales bacterium]
MGKHNLFNIKGLDILFCFILSLTSCTSGNLTESTYPQIEVSKLVTTNSKTYLEVDGIPFPLLGAQIRLDALTLCDKLSIDQVEKYFAKAQELGVNCVQIPIWWNLIESQPDQYNFSLVDHVLQFALKYNLKIEVLWFSTNMCGDSFSYLVPQYILNEPGKKLKRDNNGQFWNYYGYIYSLKLDDDWILNREKKAITNLFNHIREWDAKNGETHPVITAQIHNEPDGFIRWRMDQYHIRYSDTEPLSKETGWSMTLKAIDEIGKAVKMSTYKVVTRTNIVMGNGITGFYEFSQAKPSDIFTLDGIDIVCVDPYKTHISDIKKEILAYKSIVGNYPLIAENKGAYPNTSTLILAAVALESGYNIYDLSTSKFFIDNTNNKEEVDHGVYTWDLKEKSHTKSVTKILKGLTAAAPDLAKVKTENFAAFNIVEDSPETVKNQTIQTTNIKIDFSTNNGALAFVLDMGNYLLVYATDQAKFDFSNGTISKIETGSYNSVGEFIDGGAPYQNATSLNTDGCVLYKIEYTSSSKLTSNTSLFIGKI